MAADCTSRGLIAALVACIAVSACQSASLGRDCEWPNGQTSSSLRHDAERAEDLAIRYADASRGHRSGHFAGPLEYVRVRDACMAKLADSVARRHSVTVDEVNQARVSRPAAFDLFVGLSLAIFYIFAADRIIQRIFHTLPADDPIRTAILVVFVSFAASAMAVALGDIWSGIAEMIRLGNDHLSYRAQRIPWNHHPTALFIAGVIVFWLVALRRIAAASRLSVEMERYTVS